MKLPLDGWNRWQNGSRRRLSFSPPISPHCIVSTLCVTAIESSLPCCTAAAMNTPLPHTPSGPTQRGGTDRTLSPCGFCTCLGRDMDGWLGGGNPSRSYTHDHRVRLRAGRGLFIRKAHMSHAKLSEVVPASAQAMRESKLSFACRRNRLIQAVDTKPACFRSEARMGCTGCECPWRGDCFKLVAEWRR